MEHPYILAATSTVGLESVSENARKAKGLGVVTAALRNARRATQENITAIGDGKIKIKEQSSMSSHLALLLLGRTFR